MKITIIAAVAAATLATSLTTAAPASARQHCQMVTKQNCRPTAHGGYGCMTFQERRCINLPDNLKSKHEFKRKFKFRGRR